MHFGSDSWCFVQMINARTRWCEVITNYWTATRLSKTTIRYHFHESVITVSREIELGANKKHYWFFLNLFKSWLPVITIIFQLWISGKSKFFRWFQTGWPSQWCAWHSIIAIFQWTFRSNINIFDALLKMCFEQSSWTASFRSFFGSHIACIIFFTQQPICYLLSFAFYLNFTAFL